MHRRSTRTGTAATVTGSFAPRSRPGTRPCARTFARGRSSSSGASDTVGYNAGVSRLVVSVLVAFLALATGADGARRDGDPASDVLIYQNVYLPYRAPSQAATAALNGEVKQVFARGYRIKVAVIAQKIDLGSIPSLYNKPADYARFLGQELSSFYVGPLLIAMPAGFGIYDGGRSTAAEARVLGGVAAPRSAKPDDLASATTTAVSRLPASRSPTRVAHADRRYSPDARRSAARGREARHRRLVRRQRARRRVAPPRHVRRRDALRGAGGRLSRARDQRPRAPAPRAERPLPPR